MTTLMLSAQRRCVHLRSEPLVQPRSEMRILFLDIDGVLNRTGFRPEVSAGLRSWIEPELAGRLSEVLEITAARSC